VFVGFDMINANLSYMTCVLKQPQFSY